MPTNPTPTQQGETLDQCPQIQYPLRVEPEPGYEGVACVLDASSVLVAAMMHPEHAQEVVAAMNTRRVAVAGPRGDVTTTARHRDEAQDIIMASEEALGQCFDAATRHDLASRITEALDAATPADNEAATRLRSFLNNDYTLIARHFKDTTKDRDITGDVEDLLNAAAAGNDQLSPSARYWLTQARNSENSSNDREQAWEKLLIELVGKV